MTELNVYGRKDEIARVPEGLDKLLKKFGVTLPDLVGRLAQCPTGVRLEGQNQLDTFKDQTVIVRRLKLGEAVDVMRLDEDYYLRVENQQLPESILGAIPGRRLADLIDHDGLTPIKHLPMTNGRAIAEGDLLVQIDWPLVPYDPLMANDFDD